MRSDPSTFADGSDFAFAALLLARLRDGRGPGPQALERAPLIEQWSVNLHDGVFALTGVAWRLPLSRSAFAAPLLAIDPVGGWARTVDEWVVIGDPQWALGVGGISPDEVIRRAAAWVGQQLNRKAIETAKPRFVPRITAAAAL
jgi:hypothetical protein